MASKPKDRSNPTITGINRLSAHSVHHDQAVRYARHIALPEIGAEGQKKLLGARVLAVGAGGLGSPLLLYLAAAGVGTLGIADGDRVALSNLQRQIIHETAAIGMPKTASARDALLDLNPEVSVICHEARIGEDNAAAILSGYDIIADGSDNPATRFLLGRTCLALGKTLVSAAILGFKGQLSTFKPHLGPPHPCYECIYSAALPASATPSCAEAGVLGSLAGIMGSWQATEIVKEITGAGESLSGRLLLVDALSATTRTVAIPRDPACPCCGSTDISSPT